MLSFTQLPPQSVLPLGHTQRPALHSLPAPQLMPHPPQFFASVATNVHLPAQSSAPAGHTHKPALQLLPPPQALPQAPQLSVSLMLTQRPLHASVPVGQAHLPWTHS